MLQALILAIGMELPALPGHMHLSVRPIHIFIRPKTDYFCTHILKS
jgi:hypothetical protein